MRRTFSIIVLLFSFLSEAYSTEDITKEFSNLSFTRVSLNGPFEVRLIKSDEEKVRLTASDRFMRNFSLDNRGDQIVLDFEDENWSVNKGQVDIYYKKLEEIEVEGAVNIISNTEVTAKNLKMILEGVGKIDLTLNVEKLIVEIEGVGNVTLRGKCTFQKVSFEGLGHYDARDLMCRNTMVEASGLGKVRVHASEKFIGSTEGVGSVIYYGDPKYQEINSEGIGKIKRGDY